MSTQFTTLTEATEIVQALGEAGLNVKPYNASLAEEVNEPEAGDPSSGIYIPVYAVGPFRTPDDGSRKFYHLRFTNGADGFNAGLVKATMAIFPTRWPLMIGLEVSAARKR
jgi:hypothetical protein